MLERATRLCSDVAANGDDQLLEAALRRRMVSASRSACVGCSCRPSPALSTGQSTLSAMSCTAPELMCRMTITSGRIALSVTAVSISVSPFFTLDWAACILTTSAPRRLPAISKPQQRPCRIFEEGVDLGETGEAAIMLAAVGAVERHPLLGLVEEESDFMGRERGDPGQVPVRKGRSRCH